MVFDILTIPHDARQALRCLELVVHVEVFPIPSRCAITEVCELIKIMQLHSTSGQWRLGLLLSLLTSFLWGILPLALAVTLQTLDVYTVTWFRFLVAFGSLGVYLLYKRRLPSVEKLRVISWKLWAIATVCLATNYLLFVKGLSQTSPTTAEILIQIAPVLLGLGAIVIFKERYTWRQWLGLGILIFGFIVFFNAKINTLISAKTQYIIGCFILVLSATAWATYALAQKQLLQQLPSSNIMLGIYGGAALLFTPMAQPELIFSLNPVEFSILLFCGFNTLIAYGSFAEALEHWEASRVSSILALTPLVTLGAVSIISAFFPAWVAPEHLTLLALLGALIIVSGSVLIALGQSRKL